MLISCMKKSYFGMQLQTTVEHMVNEKSEENAEVDFRNYISYLINTMFNG